MSEAVIEPGTKIKYLGFDELVAWGPSPEYAEVHVKTGAVGTVLELDEQLQELVFNDDEFVVTFPGVDPEEGFFFRLSEEGRVWERA